MKKASDLRIPFSWSERRPIFLERCLYIPGLYDKHDEWKPLPWGKLFGNERPVCIEYCSGNGKWIAEKAKRYPEKNWVAVEKRFDRARKIWALSFRENLENLFVAIGEGSLFSRYYAPKASVSEIYVNFPDPWPKKRHAARRLVATKFLEELAELGKKGTRAMFVTDDVNYREQMVEELSRSDKWRPQLPTPHFTTEWPEYGDSFFEELWRGKGRTIYYLPWEQM